MHIPAESSQSQVDEEKAGRRDTATDGTFCEHVSLIQKTANEKATVKAQYDNMTWLY